MDRLGSREDRLQVSRRAHQWSDTFKARPNSSAGVIERSRRGFVGTPCEVVARVALRREIAKCRIVVFGNQPRLEEAPHRLDEARIGLDVYQLQRGYLGRRR